VRNNNVMGQEREEETEYVIWNLYAGRNKGNEEEGVKIEQSGKHVEDDYMEGERARHRRTHGRKGQKGERECATRENVGKIK
jgi:hypothetical protein